MRPDLEWVRVPCKEIGCWLGASREHVGKWLRAFEAAELIVLNPAWSYKSGECREAQYTGPFPE